MSRRDRICMTVAVALTLALPAPATAHVEQRSGPFRVRMGWAEEPPYSGSPTAVEGEARRRDGAPVAVPPGALGAQVGFGRAVVTMELTPTEERGNLRAAIVPTRPGTYAFHVSGSLRGHDVDVDATCSSATFDCVLEPT